MNEEDLFAGIQRIVTNPKVMLWVVLSCCVLLGFLAGNLYICSENNGTLLPNLDCVIEGKLDYCLFEGLIYQRTPKMIEINDTFLIKQIK